MRWTEKGGGGGEGLAKQRDIIIKRRDKQTDRDRDIGNPRETDTERMKWSRNEGNPKGPSPCSNQKTMGSQAKGVCPDLSSDSPDLLIIAFMLAGCSHYATIQPYTGKVTL